MPKYSKIIADGGAREEKIDRLDFVGQKKIYKSFVIKKTKIEKKNS